MLVGGRFAAGVVPTVAGVLAVSTIVICYFVATSLGHVPYWMPDITHCGRFAPERFIFRAGMIPACIFIMYTWYLVGAFLQAESEIEEQTSCTHRIANRTITTCGVLGGALLVMGSSVIESDDSMPWTVHIIGATGFFIMTFVAEVLTVLKLGSLRRKCRDVISGGSFFAKVLLLVLLVVFMVLNGVLGALHYGNWANLTEWLCTFAVIGFAMTWIHDWRRRLNVTTNLSLTARRADRMFDDSHWTLSY